MTLKDMKDLLERAKAVIDAPKPKVCVNCIYYYQGYCQEYHNINIKVQIFGKCKYIEVE